MKKFLLFIIFIIIPQVVHAEGKIAYLDIQKILQTSNIGKSTLNELNSISQKNIETIKGKEAALKKKEEEIKLKKNLLSQDELSQEIEKLKKNFINLRNEKDKLSSEFNKLKNDKMNLFFEKISPIVQEFMKENNIEILLDRKNIFIGKANSDITNDIILAINKKL